MNLTRRGFLKAVGALGATLIAPDLRLILPDEVLFDGESFIAPVREFIAYDLNGGYVVLHDVIFGKPGGYRQAHVNTPIKRADELPAIRIAAAGVLSDYFQEHGIPLTDLHGLPMPQGYEQADLPEKEWRPAPLSASIGTTLM